MKITRNNSIIFFGKIYLFLLFFIQCSENPVEQIPIISINIDVRMEVQILDSTYQFYSRPHTKIYFTTYKLQKDSTRTNFSQSDTTSCPNGWGVKLLNFRLNSKDEKIILGAACEDYYGANFRTIEIEYSELEQRIDSLNNASIIKTFAIYYN